MTPPYTAFLVVRVDAPTLADLDAEATRAVAEEVRAFVGGASGATLPETLDDGRPAFDAKAVAHLDDVRKVLRAARLATLFAVIVAGAWVLWAYRRRHARALATSLTASAWIVAGVVALAGIAALTDFGWFFTAFHGLFFEAGTWQFPADALLIRLFPEPFWAASGATWGALALAGAAVLGILGRRARTLLVAGGA
jgi:integral membrane protein (TIGR01906 family)